MAVKQYKNHESVEEEYKWDLAFLLEGKSPEERLEELVELKRQNIEVKDSKYASSDAYLKWLKKEDKNEEKFNRFTNYIENSLAINVVDSKISALDQKFKYEMYKIKQEVGPETPRFQANAKKIKEWIELSEFVPYKRTLQAELDAKKHQLPKAIQEFRTIQSRADISAEDPFNILTNSELKYDDAVSLTGKKIKVTPANRMALAKHKDPKVRKTASLSYRNAYLQHKGTLSNLLFQHFKEATVYAKLEKFDNTIDSFLYEDRVDQKMLLSLYDAVQKNMPLFRKADSLHKKFYKAKFGKAITKYDYQLELVKTKGEYTPEEAMKLTLGAFEPFGKEYLDEVKRAYKENWVDFMPIENKESGAYSIDYSYGLDKKLILMNFDGTFNSVETLAHEMGHSLHTYFADTRNDLTNSQYPIFVAEIASIFNEMMLFDHVIKTSTDDKLKFKVLQSMIQGFKGTVLRQVLWSNYEYDMYTAIENGKPLSSYDEIAKLYFENFKKYSIKKNPKYKADEQFASVYVPHFYYGFYVYKYAIGQLVANIFFQKYKLGGPEVLQTYISKFLSRGSQDWPLEILKDAGVDLTDPKTYDLGFDMFRETIKEWEKLGNKIFKLK